MKHNAYKWYDEDYQRNKYISYVNHMKCFFDNVQLLSENSQINMFEEIIKLTHEI